VNKILKNADSQETDPKWASFLLLVRDRGEQKKRTFWQRFNCLLNVVRVEKVLKGDEVDGYESSRAID